MSERSKDRGKFDRFFGPVLNALRSLGGSARSPQVKEVIARTLNLSEAELSETNLNGVGRIGNQIDWARFYLVKAGYLDAGQRGVWTLTETGLRASLSVEDARRIRSEVDAKLRSQRVGPPAVETGSVQAEPNEAEEESEGDDESSPPERIDHRSVLLATVKSLPPSGFEMLCQHLLLMAGFEQVKVSGRTGDGGLDGHGVLRLNKLVSTTVFFQCKRYQASVGAPMIRDFRGALAGRAEKGIMLTTGRFTASAQQEARRDGVVPIELVDGERLIELFEELQIGLVNARTVYDVDDGFFKRFFAIDS